VTTKSCDWVVLFYFPDYHKSKVKGGMKMLFELISIILGTTALIKGLAGIFIHDKLYGWAESHYSKKEKSRTIYLFLVYAFLMLAITFYATIYQYTAYGWILTIFISVMSLKTIGLIFNWEKTSQKLVAFIKHDGKKIWLLDILVIFLSMIFFSLALFVY